MSDLSKMESLIMQAIVQENRKLYPFLAEHIKYLKVKSRNYTGGGVYTYFCYTKEFKKSDVNEFISSSKRLIIDCFENELSFVLDISSGKIKFLEIVTNGDDTFEDKKYSFKLV